MDRLAALSRKAYTDLIGTDGFVGFFRGATPIDVIEAANIGSRPARRTGQATVSDLRAIPWVFAWSQARFALSGWFGLGSGLRTLQREDPEAHRLVTGAVFDWPPLHYIVSNVATAVATSDASWMMRYADLVTDTELRDRILGRIIEERDATVAALVDVYGGPLDERRPNIALGLDVRRPGLELLHRRQIELLGEWRDLRALGDETPRALLDELLLTVNAIASGLDATG
jgi:phosphoenolpyruvate carboxylase